MKKQETIVTSLDTKDKTIVKTIFNTYDLECEVTIKSSNENIEFVPSTTEVKIIEI